jgi:phenol hydroxylase P1 protein
VDSVLKTTAAESDHNRQVIGGWIADWREKAVTDLAPLAEAAVGGEATGIALDVLNKRIAKAGL